MIPPDQPVATYVYLGLYLVTLVLHVLSMNYVLAGQTYLAAVTGLELIGGRFPSQEAPAAKLRDWLPFALGVTITAGVAPLLFVQILYKRSFYTANLLLFHRWMAILPVLIAAFYLLYLQKSKRWSAWSARARAGVSIGIWLSFAFVAWSWTENHLLSLRDQATWTAEYASNRLFYYDVEHLPRLLVWYCGAFAVLAAALGWQLRHEQRKGVQGTGTPLLRDTKTEARAADSKSDELAGRTVRTLSALATFAPAAAIVAAGATLLVLPGEARNRLAEHGMPAAIAAAAGIALQTECWRRMLVGGRWRTGPLTGATIGALAAVVGGVLLRELRRTAAINLALVGEAHRAAGRVGGLPLFVFFFLVNGIVIYAVVSLVRRGLRPQA